MSDLKRYYIEKIVPNGKWKRFLNRNAKKLSVGEQQILSLLRALIIKPKILFLDEPSSSLDPSATLIIEKCDSSSEIIFKDHEEVYGNKFEDPMRRTPSIDKIVKATNYEPTMTIQKMIEEIITYKKINL